MSLTPLPHDATRDACAAVHGDLQAPLAAPAPPASGLETGEGGSRSFVLEVDRLTMGALEGYITFRLGCQRGTGDAYYRITIERL